MVRNKLTFIKHVIELTPQRGHVAKKIVIARNEAIPNYTEWLCRPGIASSLLLAMTIFLFVTIIFLIHFMETRKPLHPIGNKHP
jgi:hypothetical protein